MFAGIFRKFATESYGMSGAVAKAFARSGILKPCAKSGRADNSSTTSRQNPKHRLIEASSKMRIPENEIPYSRCNLTWHNLHPLPGWFKRKVCELCGCLRLAEGKRRPHIPRDRGLKPLHPNQLPNYGRSAIASSDALLKRAATLRNASTTAGSKWVPLPLTINSTVSSGDR